MSGMVNLFKELKGLFLGDVVLIYSMGKVGSSSVKNSLESIGVPVVHLHNFTGEQYVDFGFLSGGVKSLLAKVRLRLLGFAFKFSRRARVITLMRDPVARNVSVMFQGLDRLIARGVCESGSDKNDVLQYIFENYVNHDIPTNWFEREFERHTGVNIYHHDAAGRDFLRIKQNRLDLLVLKMEALNQLEVEISRFVSRPEFKLRHANVGGRKWYAEIYTTFRNSVHLDEGYLNRMYESPSVKHLYSADEVSAFRKKWSPQKENPPLV